MEDSSSNTPFYQFVRIKSISAASQYLQHQTKRSFSNNVILYFWSLKTSTLSPCSFWETEKRSLPEKKESLFRLAGRKEGRPSRPERTFLTTIRMRRKERKEGRKRHSTRILGTRAWQFCGSRMPSQLAVSTEPAHSSCGRVSRSHAATPQGHLYPPLSYPRFCR